MNKNIDDTTESLKWAYETIKEKLMFGLPEKQAQLARDNRVKGVLLGAIKEIDKLKHREKKLKLFLEFVVACEKQVLDGLRLEGESLLKIGEAARKTLKELYGEEK